MVKLLLRLNGEEYAKIVSESVPIKIRKEVWTQAQNDMVCKSLFCRSGSPFPAGSLVFGQVIHLNKVIMATGG